MSAGADWSRTCKGCRCVETVMGTVQAARTEHRRGQHGDYYGVVRGAAATGTPGLILEHSFHTNRAATVWLMDDSNLDRLAQEDRALTEESASIEARLAAMGDARPQLQRLFDLATANASREESQSRLLDSGQAFFLEGWVPAERWPELVKALEKIL